MSKKTSHNPIPMNTKTLRDVLPETDGPTSPPQSKTAIKKKDIKSDDPLKNEINSLYVSLPKITMNVG